TTNHIQLHVGDRRREPRLREIQLHRPHPTNNADRRRHHPHTLPLQRTKRAPPLHHVATRHRWRRRTTTTKHHRQILQQRPQLPDRPCLGRDRRPLRELVRSDP